jgi:O-antigen ligase
VTTPPPMPIRVGDRRGALQQFPTLFAVAVGAVALALLVAPFRASSGLRATCFLVAFSLLLFVWWQTKLRTIELPTGRFLRAGILIWVLTVFAYSITSRDAITSLESWRGDVLTPVLAGLVCYNICHSARQLKFILLSLLLGLFTLAGMVVADPFQPNNIAHTPRYVHVGWLATWVVLLASTLPLAWLVRWPQPTLARALGFVALIALLLAAWFSANRIVWICFGVMFAIYIAQQMRGVSVNPLHRALLLAVGLLLAALMFYLASGSRAADFPEAKLDAISILKQDDRQVIWQAAWQTIQERPLAGYGYALEASHEALAKQFADPGFRAVFRQAHNIVLNYAVQMGIPGAAALLLLFASLLHAFWWRCQDRRFSRMVATCGLMLVVGFFLRNMTDDYFHRHAALLFGTLIGLLLAVSEWGEDAQTP